MSSDKAGFFKIILNFLLFLAFLMLNKANSIKMRKDEGEGEVKIYLFFT